MIGIIPPPPEAKLPLKVNGGSVPFARPGGVGTGGRCGDCEDGESEGKGLPTFVGVAGAAAAVVTTAAKPGRGEAMEAMEAMEADEGL